MGFSIGIKPEDKLLLWQIREACCPLQSFYAGKDVTIILHLQEPEEAEKGADKEEKLKKLKGNWVESRNTFTG